jgi:tetratricopeptide (TPR) repeat protein
MTARTIDDEIGSIYSIQFIERGEVSNLPAPLVRLSTCGGLSIEVLEEVVSVAPPQARYRRLSPKNLRGRGIAPALTFLKLLLSQPRRYAKKDFLREHFSRLDEEAATDDRVDDVASLLRGLLYPSSGKETPEDRKRRDKVRQLLVAYVHGSKGSGGGYCLGEYPLVWIDTDALAYHITFAARMDRFRDPKALPSWERAYQIASSGPYLLDELYSDWSNRLREEVEGYLRQSVHALSRLYLTCYGEAGEEELQIILHNYWLAHKTDEDVLRPLMELLGKQERHGEALDYYAQFEAVLAKQGSTKDGKGYTPDERTRDIAEYLRTKQIQREQPLAHPMEENMLPANALALASTRQRETRAPFSGPATQDILEVVRGLEGDIMDQRRRQLLQQLLGGIGATSLTARISASYSSPAFSVPQQITKIPGQLEHYQQQLSAYWDGYFTSPGESAITAIETAIDDLQSMSPYANALSGSIQELLCQYHQLAADQFRDRGRFSAAFEHGHLAVYLAEQMRNVELLAAALYRRGLTYFDAGQIDAAFRDLSEALPFAKISRVQLKGMVYMEAGRFQAYLARSEQDHVQAMNLLDQTAHIVYGGERLEPDAGHVKLNQGRFHIGRAATLLALQQPRQAEGELCLAEQLTPAEYQRRHAYIKILRARSYFSQKKFEQATHLALEAFHLCLTVYSESNIADILRLHKELSHSPFAESPSFLQLGSLIDQHQKNTPSNL